MVTYEIFEKIKNILDYQIRDDVFYSLTSLDNHLKDSVSHNFPQFNFKQEFLNRDWATFEGYTLNGLGHLSANPSDKDRADILNQAYVYLSEVDKKDNTLKIYPNYSEDTSKQFVDDLISISREEFNQYMHKSKGPRAITILSGERGLGKTVFINHLFTKYNRYLNSKKVIWIRLDLSINYGSVRPNLIHLFLSKLVKVILMYYLDMPEFKNLISDIKQYFNSERYADTEVRLKFHENIQTLYNTFYEKKGSKKLTEDMVYKDIAEQFRNYAIKAGYSFIFILDNFDKLDITPNHSKKFLHYYNQLDIITDPDERPGAAIVIVTRNDTRIFLEQNASPSVNKRNNLIKEIKNIPFEKIIKKRLEYLKKNISKIAIHKKWDLEHIENHLDEFEDYVLTTAENKIFDKYISNMDLIYGENNRIKVQLLQLLYHNFLDVKNSKYKYRLVEAMCKAGYSFPPCFYSYRLDNGNLIPVSHNKIFDNVFLPLIFSFPYIEEKNRIQIPISRTYMLLGLRIIQYIQAFSKINNHDGIIPISLQALNEFLNKLYSYDSKIINALIEEYCDCGLLKLHGDNLLLSKNYNSLEIIALPKVNLLFGSIKSLSIEAPIVEKEGDFPIYGNILADVAYLNMCAQRLLINEVSLSSNPPYIKSILLYEERSNNITSWTVWKIINSLSLYSLIKKCLQIENKHIITSSLSQYELNVYKNITDIDADELAEQLKSQYKKIFSEMRVEELDNLEKYLNKYIDYWIK
ncbi:MAG: hypothetical protein AB1521_03655 [Bacteroidota bacterium]